jgi:hypothetical protein
LQGDRLTAYQRRVQQGMGGEKKKEKNEKKKNEKRKTKKRKTEEKNPLKSN